MLCVHQKQSEEQGGGSSEQDEARIVAKEGVPPDTHSSRHWPAFIRTFLGACEIIKFLCSRECLELSMFSCAVCP